MKTERQRVTRLAIVPLALIVGLGLAACGKTSDEDKQAANTVVAPGQGGSVTTSPPESGASVASQESGASMSGSTGATASLSDVDREFLSKATSSGLAEVQASRQIAEKTQNAEVKNFAEHMVKEHSAVNDELMKLAQSKRLDLPAAPSTQDKQSVSKLGATTGPEAEKAYIEEFGVKGRKDAIDLLEKRAQEGSDPDLKRFAESKLPALKEHLEHAQEVAQNVNR